MLFGKHLSIGPSKEHWPSPLHSPTGGRVRERLSMFDSKLVEVVYSIESTSAKIEISQD
jgi:hypothetical protein